MTTTRLPLDEVSRLCTRALEANGASPKHAAAVARTVTAAERDGCASHGLFRMPGYLKSLRSGKVKRAPEPSVRRLAKSVIQVDGDLGYAPLAHEVGRQPLIDLARETGIAAESIVRTHHFSALWAEVEPLAEAGLVAMAFTSYTPFMAPWGAKKPFFGTNPMAFAWPRGAGNPPMVFDQASAAMARGEIQIAARDGHTVPPGTGIDADGNPSTDPAAILKGAQLPFGGYKGSAIALMVDLLAGGLLGEAFSDEAGARDNADGGPPQGGELILAIDPASFGDPEGWRNRSEEFLQRLLGLEGTRLPGDRRRRNRQRIAVEGATVPTALLEDIERLAKP